MPNYAMLAGDCLRVALMDVLKTNKVPRWHFMDIESEDISRHSYGTNTEVRNIYFVGSVILPKCSVKARVMLSHPHGDEWRAHNIELRTWTEAQREEEGQISFFSASSILELFPQ